jgi:hypothetical protein
MKLKLNSRIGTILSDVLRKFIIGLFFCKLKIYYFTTNASADMNIAYEDIYEKCNKFFCKH